MMWRRSVSSTAPAPRARQVPPGLFPPPVQASGFDARCFPRLSSVLQWSVMRPLLARRSHPAPTTPFVFSSFEGRAGRCPHPLLRRPTGGRWLGVVCWPPDACQRLWSMHPPQSRVPPSGRHRSWRWSGRLGWQLAANLHRGEATQTLLLGHDHYTETQNRDNSQILVTT